MEEINTADLEKRISELEGELEDEKGLNKKYREALDDILYSAEQALR